MQVILAGYNLDRETIRAFQAAHPGAGNFTPETISAAYARISRDSRPVNELRAIALGEVEKARQSNQNIVFDMGHSSIAEHAVFNIDILGVSRFIVEEIEKSRLCSYTEKSQRYILLKDDFVLPAEIKRAGFEDIFVGIIGEQNRFYHELYEKLNPYVFEKHRELAMNPANRSTLEGWAKEDARYIISLATMTQLGMTLNARNLELMLRRLAAHPLTEAGEFSHSLYEATKDIAPSLVRYTEATDYDRLTRLALQEKTEGLLTTWGKRQKVSGGGRGNTPSEHDQNCPYDESRCDARRQVALLYATPEADERIVASLIHSSSDIPMAQCLNIVSLMGGEEKEDLLKTAFRYMQPYDPALREFEHVDLQFELTVSASCFAQLKRHRMATITCQDYDPALGVTIPPAISETGMERQFMEIIARTEEAYNHIRKTAPQAAGYILTNAHRKRVAMKINARELYHIARIRGDRHAQWDI
ncbi:MAG: FAD-dependent thymidylate synthase, partial [Syntrophales bacterium]|nr:FAD-dependent thymidylate synthase [Syntrophales bacterium]